MTFKDTTARPATGTTLTIAQIQRILDDKTAEVAKLQRQRNKLQRKIDLLDRHIDRAGGDVSGSRRPPGTRARNESSLLDTIESVLRTAGKPMRVQEITDAVLATGYQSGSANFRGIVNQTLIKDKRFGQVERGVYELKKAAK